MPVQSVVPLQKNGAQNARWKSTAVELARLNIGRNIGRCANDYLQNLAAAHLEARTLTRMHIPPSHPTVLGALRFVVTGLGTGLKLNRFKLGID